MDETGVVEWQRGGKGVTAGVMLFMLQGSNITLAVVRWSRSLCIDSTSTLPLSFYLDLLPPQRLSDPCRFLPRAQAILRGLPKVREKPIKSCTLGKTDNWSSPSRSELREVLNHAHPPRAILRPIPKSDCKPNRQPVERSRDSLVFLFSERGVCVKLHTKWHFEEKNQELKIKNC